MEDDRGEKSGEQECGVEKGSLRVSDVHGAARGAEPVSYKRMPSSQYRRIVILLALLLIPYSVVTYNHIGEDCFITYRYVENLVAGHSLVFNIGERVEGYSNFLWLLVLALFRWLGFSALNVSKLLGALSNSGTLLVAAFFFVRKGEQKVDWLNLTAPLFVFFNPFLHIHSDQGLETCFYAFEMLLVAFLFYRRRFLLCSLVLSALALTRAEGFAYFFVLAPLLVLEYRRSADRRRFLAQVLLRYAVPWVLIVGAYFIWRRLYFGQWLPNTVYAKVSKANFYQNPSFGILWDFVMSCSFLPLVSLLVFASIRHIDAERRRALIILLVLIGGVVGYSLLIGNIFYFGYRHQVPIIVLSVLLLQEFLREVRGGLAVSRVWSHWGGRRLFAAIWLVCAMLNFYTVRNGDAPRTRLHVRTYEFLTRWDLGERLTWYLETPVLLRAEAGRWIDCVLPCDATIAMDQIGQLAYYAKRYTIDLLGLTDLYIAHKGYSLEYLLRRNPTHVVFFANRKGIPHIPFLAETKRDPQFTSHYKLIAILRANHLYDLNEFLVFARRDIGNDVRLRTFYLGLNGVEWNRRWRVE
jgi:arabinofuranosyltransferase